MAPILFDPTQTPVCSDRVADTPNSAQVRIIVSSSAWTKHRVPPPNARRSTIGYLNQPPSHMIVSEPESSAGHSQSRPKEEKRRVERRGCVPHELTWPVKRRLTTPLAVQVLCPEILKQPLFLGIWLQESGGWCGWCGRCGWVSVHQTPTVWERGVGMGRQWAANTMHGCTCMRRPVV